MFKKIFLFSFGIALLVTACHKDDKSLFDKTPDQRLKEALDNYQKALTQAPYGWNVYVFPAGLESQDVTVGGFTYYMKFTDSNRVTMYSDFDSTMAATPLESGYRLKAVQRPSLFFDTYSYIHVPSDPDPEKSKSPVANLGGGFGWGSDFEFSFASEPVGDTIHLKGNFNNSEAIMVKATQQEAAAYANKGLAGSLTKFKDLTRIVNYFKRMTVGTQQFDISVNERTRMIVFTWVENGVVKTFTTGYYYSLNGIILIHPFMIGTLTITSLTNFNWDPVNSVLNLNAGGTTATIVGASKPIQVDLNAVRNWWQQSVDNGTYYISYDGFTVNGVPDAYGVRTIPGFQFLLFWAQFGVSGGVNYDLLGFVSNNSINYGPAFRPPTFTTDGRIIFPFFGTLGTVPASVANIVTNTRVQMTEANGYYIIQTSANSYDMVSAKDAKSWITWEF
jgi:hypothetical protein